MKFAYIQNEKLMGWYSPEIHANIPSPSIEVSDEVWQTALATGANAYVNEQFVVKDFSTPEQIKQRRYNELKSFLESTDYKALPDYDKPNESIKVQRQEWRNELRQLEAQ